MNNDFAVIFDKYLLESLEFVIDIKNSDNMTGKELVYIYSEQIAYELSKMMYENKQPVINSKMILDYIKARCKHETLHDEILNATIVLLKEKYAIVINRDLNIDIKV